jgi:Domain of unknown function (DUF1735)
MNKFKQIAILLTVVTIVSLGCLKDKKFNNNEYGITDPLNTPKGVSFPLAVNEKNTTGLDAVSSTPQILKDLIVASLDNGVIPSSDVKVNFVIDNSIVLKYNIENELKGKDSINVFRPTLYSIPGSTITVKAGGRLGQLPLTVPSTVPLSLDSSYAIGLRIVSNDGGYTIAENLKNLLLVFNLKNKFDGVYRLKGFHNRNVPDYTIPYDVDVHMVTTGPNNVVFFYPNPGPNANAHPINGNGGSYYGSFAPEIGFDANANSITGFYSALTCREWYAGTLPMAIVSGSNSRYEPVTKKMYLSFFYNNNPLRSFFDTLTYKGPRP